MIGHYTESFYSIQGEGSRMGNPSVFLRMFGCNFRCKSFGRKEKVIDKINPEVKEIIKNLNSYNNLDDLPLVKTGCDSYVTIYPEFKKFVKKETPEELCKNLTNLTPNGNWHGIDLIITGGEPLLGWQKFYPELLNLLQTEGLKYVTFETNTTQKLQPEFQKYLNLFPGKVIWSCSPKLSGAGELQEIAINPDVAKSYFSIANSSMYFKFVVDPEQDLAEVEEVLHAYKNMGVDVPVYLMPVGGCYDEYKANSTAVAELALSKGWRYSPRLHIDCFGNQWNT